MFDEKTRKKMETNKQKDLKHYSDETTYSMNPIWTFITMSTLGIISLWLTKKFFPHDIGSQMTGAWKILPTILGSFILTLIPIRIFNKWFDKVQKYELKQTISTTRKNCDRIQTSSILLVIPALWLEPKVSLLEFMVTFTIIVLVTNGLFILSIIRLKKKLLSNHKRSDEIRAELCVMCQDGDEEIKCPYNNFRPTCYTLHPERWEEDKKILGIDDDYIEDDVD